MLGLSLKEIASRLAKREVSAIELTEASLNEIEKLNPQLNAFITVTREQAMLQAKEADAKRERGEETILTGVPLGLKDLFCTKGIKTTAASKILANFVPPYESTVSQKLLDAGAVIVGKTNLDEFAMGSSNLTSAFGSVKNPWRNKNSPETVLVPGGSSGGSAAAVAAFLVYGATGTDTGGSIRQPAAFCGIPGIKPTYGRCSRFGVIAFASSLDQPGPFARTVEDCALLLETMAGYDRNDSTSARRAVPVFSQACGQSLKGKRIGVPKEYQVKGMPAEIEIAWQVGLNWLKEAGAEIVSVSLPHTKYGLAAYYIIATAECSSNLARYDGIRYGLRVHDASLDELYEKTRAEGFGQEVKRRVLIGTYVLSAGYYDAYYVKAQKIRSLILKDFTAAFDKADALLTPTAPSAAFSADKRVTDPIEMYLNDILTVPASMAGVPAMSVPTGLNKDGLPLGLQIIGRPFDEETVFTVASILEKAADFKLTPTIRAGE